MSQHNRLSSGEERKLSPLAQYEEVDVVFPDTPHTDLEVPYTNLKPPSPEQIDYQVVRQSQAAVIYHDVSGTRKPWPRGFILLRSNVGGARATLRLSTRQREFAPVLLPVANINPTVSNVLLDGANHTDTDAAAAPAQGDIIVRNSAGKWIRKALGAAGTMLRSDGTDPQWSADGSGLTSLNASNISSGTLADARLSSNVPLKNAIATISAIYTFSSDPVFNANAIPETAIADGSLLARLAANETVAGTWTFTPGLKERGRSTAIGEWTSVSYNSGDYTASAGTWTVDSGDVSYFKYTLVGKTMTVAFRIISTSTGVGMGSELRVAVPGGFVPNGIIPGACHLNLNGTYETGLMQANSAGYIQIFRNNFTTAFPSSVTNAIDVRGQMSFEVN